MRTPTLTTLAHDYAVLSNAALVHRIGDSDDIALGALDELPPAQRESIELPYVGGLSQSEIAERTGQPLGTIKTRIRLAMAKLRTRLSLLRERAP